MMCRVFEQSLSLIPLEVFGNGIQVEAYMTIMSCFMMRWCCEHATCVGYEEVADSNPSLCFW